MPFTFSKLSISDVILVSPKMFPDGRGFFLETFKRSDFEKNGIVGDFVQDNHSFSTKGVLRGLHYQLPPYAQAKLVRCIRGTILDVAVDIRQSSPTFGKWVSAELSESNKNMLYIPVGFAHGFIVQSEEAEILYKVQGGEYAPQSERGIIYNDPDINIDWGRTDILASDKDILLPRLMDAEVFK